MKYIFIILIGFFLGSVNTQKSYAQKLASYNAEQLNKRIANKDTLYIVNFWATWCIPCVKELPAFDSLYNAYKGKPVKVILLSFDFEEQYPEKITQWLQKKKVQAEVIWFNESKPNDYIPKIAPDWEGALPATILVNNKKKTRELVAQSVTFEQLNMWVKNQQEK